MGAIESRAKKEMPALSSISRSFRTCRTTRPGMADGDADAQDARPHAEVRGWLQEHRLTVDAGGDRSGRPDADGVGGPLPPGTPAARAAGAGWVDDRHSELPPVECRAGARSGGSAQPVLVVAHQDDPGS